MSPEDKAKLAGLTAKQAVIEAFAMANTAIDGAMRDAQESLRNVDLHNNNFERMTAYYRGVIDGLTETEQLVIQLLNAAHDL